MSLGANQNQYPLEPLFGRILSPFERFLRRTTAGGIILVVTTAISLVLASMLGEETIHHFWEQRLSLTLGDALSLDLSLHQWVNDALMALFFLLVGLELKREMLVGELASIRDAALPIAGALGGMVVPALIYAGLNLGGPGMRGWGIPMATDIAFAVGILVLLAWRIPRALIIFVTALAIVDDLGAVLVIAVFYTADLDLVALGAAGVLLGVLVLLNRGGVRRSLPYAVVGVLLWLAVLQSGVHATLAGILLAFTIPALPSSSPAQFERRIAALREEFASDARDGRSGDDPLSNPRMTEIAEAIEHSAAAVQSPQQRIEHGLTPWVTFGVIPVFALSNAGIDLTAVEWGDALSNAVTQGVLLGLVLGKFVGVSLFSAAAVKLGLARLPTGVRWSHLLGAAWLCGIGFTMSLFIAQLAFPDPALMEDAKLGILLASAVASAIGLTWLYAVSFADRGTAKPGRA